MITYMIHGSLPATWEDFYCQDETGGIKKRNIPHITLMTKREADGGVEEDEGWLFIVLDVDEIDEKLARETIANALDVGPDEIHIDQGEWCQTVANHPVPRS